MTMTAMMERRLVRSREDRSLRADRGSMTRRDDMNVINFRLVSRPCAPHCANTVGMVSPASASAHERTAGGSAACVTAPIIVR